MTENPTPLTETELWEQYTGFLMIAAAGEVARPETTMDLDEMDAMISNFLIRAETILIALGYSLSEAAAMVDTAMDVRIADAQRVKDTYPPLEF